MRRSLSTAIAWIMACLRDGLAARKGVALPKRNPYTGSQSDNRTRKQQ